MLEVGIKSKPIKPIKIIGKKKPAKRPDVSKWK